MIRQHVLGLLLLAALVAAADPPPGLVIDAATNLSVVEDGGDLAIPFTLTDVLAGDGSDRIAAMFATLAASPEPAVYVRSVARAAKATTGTLVVQTLAGRHGPSEVHLSLVTVDGQVVDRLLTVEVLRANLPPTLAENVAASIGVQGTVVYGPALLQLTDPETSATDQLRFVLTTPPAHGDLRLEGLPLSVGGGFTQAQVDAGAVSYRNQDGAADQWSFTWDDGAARPAQGPATAIVQVGGKALPAVSLFGSVSWQEHALPVLCAATALVEDGDSPTLAGGSLRAWVVQSYGDELSIQPDRSGADVAGRIGVSGSSIDYSGEDLGTWSGTGSAVSPLVVQFTTAAATPAAAQALLRRLAFANSSNVNPDPRTIAVIVNDGDAGASAVATLPVTVIPVNDPPRITGETWWSLPMGFSRDILLYAEDPDSYTLNWTVMAPPAHGTVTVLRQDTTYHEYRYTPAPGFSGSDGFSLRVTDGGGATGYAIVTLTVCGPNDPPLLPLADPPREAFPGDTLSFMVPWDRSPVNSGPIHYGDQRLAFSVDGSSPPGLQVFAADEATAWVTWSVPVEQPTGVHVRFKLIAAFHGPPSAGVLPFSILIRPLPGGGG